MFTLEPPLTCESVQRCHLVLSTEPPWRRSSSNADNVVQVLFSLYYIPLLGRVATLDENESGNVTEISV
jgi:hypothetical protein